MVVEDQTAEVFQLRELLQRADVFRYSRPGAHRSTDVTIEARSYDKAGNPQSWAVLNNGDCLARNGEWCHEGLSSGRTKKFIRETRYATLAEALWFARKHGVIGPDNRSKIGTGYAKESVDFSEK